MLANLLGLILLAEPSPVPAPSRVIAFAREDQAWVAVDLLCIGHPLDGLGYLTQPQASDGPAELHEQAARDGKVTRKLALDAARSTTPGSTLHASDCGMGSCWDSYERPISGSSAVLQFQGALSNYLRETSFRWEISGTAPDGPVREKCFGGRTLLACVSPRWEVLVETTGDPNIEGAHLAIHYRARHLEGTPEELDLEKGKVRVLGSRYQASFTNKGFAYTLEGSADPASPGATLRVTKGSKTAVVDAPCTAYAIDPAGLKAASKQ
jgi:hypothetical protein